MLQRIRTDDAMNRDRVIDNWPVKESGKNLNATRILVLRPQLRWTAQSTTVHVMAPQRTFHTARLSELSSTISNLRVYSMYTGIDMQLANQQLSNQLTSAALQTENGYHSPSVISNRTRPDQVLRKRKFQPGPTSTSSVGGATKGENTKRRKVQNSVKTTRVPGGLNKEKPGIPATPQRLGLGEIMQSELANGRANASPHALILHQQVAESQPVERISPNTNCNLLAWQSELVPKTSTGPTGPLQSLNYQSHICHATSHVRNPQISRGQVFRGATGTRLLPWPNGKVNACTTPVGPNRSHMHVNKIKLIRMHNEIDTCIFLCEHGKASVKEEEKLLTVLDEIITISHNPGLTLQMLADAKLGQAVRRLLADDRYGPQVKGKARTILDIWTRSFRRDRQCVRSRPRVNKSDQPVDPQRPTK